MQKTENLGLNIFESSDPVLAESFNENTRILDAVLHKKASIAIGDYVGDGTSNRLLTFSKRPELVIISSPDDESTAIFTRGFNCALYFYYAGYGFATSQIFFTWDDENNGIQFATDYLNRNSKNYHYLALFSE